MLLGANKIYRFVGFELDPVRRVLLRGGEPVLLTPKAFDVLAFLVLNPGRVISKDELLKAIWPDSFVEEGNLAQYVSALRKALGEESRLIATVPGRGYQFGAQVIEARSSNQARPGIPVQPPADARMKEVPHHREWMPARGVVENPPPASESPVSPSQADSRRSTVLRWGGVSLLAAVLVALAVTFAWRHYARPPMLRKVLVADFTNSTGDAAFDRTLKRALEIDLEQSPYIDVMNERDILSTLKLMGLDNASPFSFGVAKEICERGHRQALLTGNIASVGREYLLTIEAVDCATGRELASAKAVAASKETVLVALDSVADHVRRGLGESGQTLEGFQVPIADATTPSLEALKSYSIGQYLDAQGKSEVEALSFYQKAVELDPKFAMAYGAIATEYYNLAEYNEASQFYRKAFELSSRISAKEKFTIQAHYYCEGQKDVLQGIQVYWMWVDTYPHDWSPWVNLANEYTQLGQYSTAISTGERAIEEGPNRGMAYSVLARACRRANRFADAKSIAQRAEQRKIDSVGLHVTLMQIAYAENDSSALAREISWGESHNVGWYFLDNQAGGEAAAGHYTKMEELLRSAYDSALNDHLPETADEILIDQAQMEFDLGMPAAARATLNRLRSPDSASPLLAILRANLGDTAAAQRFLTEQSSSDNSGTFMANLNLPLLRAALAMQRGRPLDAIAVLESARPYELASYNVLTQRAIAYVKAGQLALAVSEYQKILANPGIDPVSPLYNLAHLDLARVYALQHNPAASRGEYEKFFDAWKNADENVPVLKQARAEYSRLK